MTPLNDPEEVRTLMKLAGAQGEESEWTEVIGSLGITEAAIVPRDPSQACLPQRFTVAQRLISYVRHRTKCIDVPMPIDRAFHFTCNGRNFGPPARTLKEFVNLQDRLPVKTIEGHAK